MKHRIVEVAARSQRVERSVGDAPAIGKLTRLSEVDAAVASERKGRRREGRHEGEEVDRLTRSMVQASAVVGLSLVVILVGFWVKNQWGQTIPAPDRGPPVSVSSKPIVEAHESRATWDEALAFDRMSRALAVRQAAKVADYFRVPVTGSPEQVIGFLEGMQVSDGLVVGLEAMPVIRANGMRLGRVIVDTELDGQRRQRLALWVHDAEGGWRIDHAAFARAVEPSWSALLEGKAQHGVIRVMVKPTTAGQTEADPAWDRWHMHSPDVKLALRGSCRAGSAQSMAMRAIVSAEAEAAGMRATLAVRPMAGGEYGHFEILRVLAEDWVLGDKPYDERFADR